MNEKLIDANRVTIVTLVGYFGDFPREYGNCFSVEASDSKQYKIVNFNHENLEEVINNGIADFPIKISVLSNSHAVIVDGRIPNEWYSNKFCEICTPDELLPAPQRIRNLLDIQRGIRKESIWEIDGKKMKSVSYKTEMQPGLINAPFKYVMGEPTILQVTDFEPRKTLASRYSVTKINSDFYTENKLSGGTENL
jgi:hypothetical protein